MDIFDADPKNEAWRCTSCSRIYIFNKKKTILRYVIEEDYRG
ncbi:hypothetical protein PaecuDRAFT_4362 [Paenibacillus curdlanolyticus YK9]|uniref:Uncharacterized protein n=1 Tax=Paenibacillus curdlanolyticus YK9 TaxID=717606 RepID=E0IFC1_9BACL|nr:hypothetical protein PaecuDRAFT_4362 [Paenibacillus curdlanolyticus YK9]